MNKLVLTLALITAIGVVQIPSVFAIVPPSQIPGCTGNPHDFQAGTGNPHAGGFIEASDGNPHDAGGSEIGVSSCPGSR